MSDRPNQPEGVDDAVGEKNASPQGEIDSRLAEAEQQIAELKEQLRDQQLRAMADLDNVRKRAEREITNGARFGAERLLGDLLAICDSLELGLKAAKSADASAQAIGEGLELTLRQFTGVLEKHGVVSLDPAGEVFNPEWHEAVAMVEAPQVPPNHVVEVLQKGYRLHERLLRPARVAVARAASPES